MEVEVQSVPKEYKTKLQVKLRSYKSELAKYKSEVVSKRTTTLAEVHSLTSPSLRRDSGVC